MNNQQLKLKIKLNKSLYFFLALALIFIFTILGLLGWMYYKIQYTDDLAVYLSQKLSRPDKNYTISISRIKEILPIIIAENVCYEQNKKVSSLAVNISELTIFPDYLKKPLIGTHSFQLKNASMTLTRPNFSFSSPNIELSGQYNQKQIYISSSTWDIFDGKIYLSGHINTALRPNPYEINAKLIYVKLEQILKNTKYNNLYTGDVYGNVYLTSSSDKTPHLNWKLSLSITNGTYSKPELVEKINSALKKIGLHSTLEDLAEEISHNSFSLTGDFTIKDKVYKTDNVEVTTPWGKVRYIGTIGPKTAMDGVLYIKYRHYTEFHIKLKGEDKKHLNYEVSDGDKAHIASIFVREVTKGTEKRIKNEGKRWNKQLNKFGKKVKEILSF